MSYNDFSEFEDDLKDDFPEFFDKEFDIDEDFDVNEDVFFTDKGIEDSLSLNDKITFCLSNDNGLDEGMSSRKSNKVAHSKDSESFDSTVASDGSIKSELLFWWYWLIGRKR